MNEWLSSGANSAEFCGENVAAPELQVLSLRHTVAEKDVVIDELHPVSWTHGYAAFACSSYFIGLMYPSVECRRIGL